MWSFQLFGHQVGLGGYPGESEERLSAGLQEESGSSDVADRVAFC